MINTDGHIFLSGGALLGLNVYGLVTNLKIERSSTTSMAIMKMDLAVMGTLKAVL